MGTAVTAALWAAPVAQAVVVVDMVAAAKPAPVTSLLQLVMAPKAADTRPAAVSHAKATPARAAMLHRLMAA